ncbi:MAG: enterotoxin, partial [Gammaproteobacteria bacterium]|nr:enterotoxin [Gammaproteobacteria bacterium]
GGDPARGEVYGWASWAPGRAVIALRNPSAQPQAFELALDAMLELPASEPLHWQATPAFAPGSALELRADKPARVTLKPYEVLVLDLLPGQSPSRPRARPRHR